MSEKRKRLVIVCPGRGSYTREELGFIAKYHARIGDAAKSAGTDSRLSKHCLDVTLKAKSFVGMIDARRASGGLPTISELDGARQFQVSRHTPGEHASTLIHTCAMLDLMSIDQERFEIVAVTGNSLGWYLALAAGGALTAENAFTLIQTMGSMMAGGVIGGQVIFPIVDEAWQVSPKLVRLTQKVIEEVHASEEGHVYPSIRLGGYLVMGGDESGIRSLMKRLPPVDEKYPMKLVNHAAFHTPVLESVSEKAFMELGVGLFREPTVPLIDGRGKIWQPYATDPGELHHYTLGHQVTRTYDFTAAITVALKEFAPDHLVLLGPGASLGGAIGQILIQNNWRGVTSKDSFMALQQQSPFLISMGREEQRRLLD
jgi:[acyl-carrier-protein] S-malonyltransferase